MSNRKDLARYKSNWQMEVDGAATYRALAAAETRAELREVYTRLAASEEKHAEFWRQKLAQAGVQLPAKPRPSTRARIMAQLAKLFGPGFVLPTLAGRETADQRAYDNQPDARGVKMGGDERSHAKVLRVIAGATSRGMEGGMVARIEGRHRGVGGNALRAAVLGANDGLGSNLSLIMGVAGAVPDPHTVLIAGMAGLLAGASSMAMGEWLSVQSARELHQRQIEVETEELAEAPEEEMEELALIYQAKGLSKEKAHEVARGLMSDPANMLDTLVREELGVDPDELGGSAWEAAITSFFLFAIGAIIPVIPFFFLQGWPAVALSLALGCLALFTSGAAITLVTGRSVWYTGLRQLCIGLGAAAATFGIGKLIGVTLAG